MFHKTFDVLLAATPEGPTPNGVATRTLETVGSTQKAVVDTLSETFSQIIGMAPNVIAAVVILVVGYVVARLLARLATALCTSIGLETAAERSGLTESMKQVGITRNVPAIVGLIVFWLLMCVSIMAGFRVLELQVLSESMQQVVNYIPKILVATVVVVIGLLAASLLRGIVATSADRVGITYAENLAGGCYYILALITFLAAASHLGLQLELVETLILIAFGALAAGLGLALGLGGRDVMGGILAGYYIRQRFVAGDHVSVGSMEGTVREVGAVATIVETEEDGLMHRHSVPNTLLLKEGVR